ncbi:PfkB family carbohydrate kinase [Mangrovibacter phragmitis]|uniref:PfkB family carbohydrate kinase n=1 Tax=Mangrovibacter phragmitis TaxID=1691903 RepID=UPI003369FFB1
MHIYVAGNITVDETWQCSALPHKGESLHGKKIMADTGGKGANQAIVLSRCGLPVTLIAARGNDHYGEWIYQQLQAETLQLFPETPLAVHTDTSIIFTTNDDDNAIITSCDAASALETATITALLETARPGDVLVQQGNFTPEKTRALFTCARSKQMLTVFNPSPVQEDFRQLWPLVDIAVVNEHESRLLQPDTAHTLVVETLGSQGSRLHAHGHTEHVPSVAATVADTTGAGDTFLAVMLASALLRNTRPDALALHHASQAAAITISRAGTRLAFPSRATLAALLAQAG